MYYQHFGLSGSPFQHTVSPTELYRSQEHSEALAALEWGLFQEPTGFTMLLGEPGTGKTTLVGSLIAQQSDRAIAAYLSHPRLEFDELMRLVFRQLGVEPPPSSKLECLDAMKILVRRAAPDQSIAIIVDEAQDLNSETFEELRLLANYAQDNGRLLHIILVGQPRLADLLKRPELRQFNERVGARAVLYPMQPSEIYEYIDYRLRARSGSARSVFSRAALRELMRHSGGIARRANVLCHNAMLAAYSTGARKVRLKDVSPVVVEYENLTCVSRQSLIEDRVAFGSRRSIWRLSRPIAALLVALLIGMGITSLLISWHSVRRYQPQDPVASGAYREMLRERTDSNQRGAAHAQTALEAAKPGHAKLVSE